MMMTLRMHLLFVINFLDDFHSDFVEFVLQDGLFFKGSQLCVPKYSM